MHDGIRLLGALLIAAAGVLVGICAAREYAYRVRECEGMIAALARMRAEIEVRLTPMSDIFAVLAEEDSVCTPFFAALCDRMAASDGEMLGALWQRTARDILPESASREIFSALGASLGCYDAAQECAAIGYTMSRLETELAAARETSAVQGGLRRKLGAAAGVGFAVLFL